MFKVNVSGNQNSSIIKSELFVDGVHAELWASEQREATGLFFEVIDLKKDPSWVENDIKEKRKKEYPEINDVIEALLEVHEGRPEKLTEIMLKRAAIKIKYPKGVK